MPTATAAHAPGRIGQLTKFPLHVAGQVVVQLVAPRLGEVMEKRLHRLIEGEAVRVLLKGPLFAGGVIVSFVVGQRKLL